MIPYLICLFAVFVLLSQVGDKDHRQSVWSNPGWWLSLLILILFAGLRAYSVGTDTYAYLFAFKSYLENLKYTLIPEDKTEEGYLMLQKLAASLSGDFTILLLLISSIVCTCIYISISKLSEKVWISVFVYLTMGFYTFFFNGARQGIAIAIYTLSFYFLLRKKFIYYTAIVLVAYLFHRSVLLAIPLYFLFHLKFSYKNLLLMVIVSFVAITNVGSFVEMGAMVSSKYAGYDQGSTGGQLLTLFFIALALFFIVVRNRINERVRPTYDVYLNMLLTGTFVYVVVILSGINVETSRLGMYFMITMIFLWPMVFDSVSRQDKLSFTCLFLVFHLVYFILSTGRMGHLTPYLFV